MQIFNFKIISLKKYEEQKKSYEEKIEDLKNKNDELFWEFNKKIQDFQRDCDFNYNKKLGEEKAKMKKEFDFLRVIRKKLDKPVISDAEEYNKWLDCYYKVRNNILNYEIK